MNMKLPKLNLLQRDIVGLQIPNYFEVIMLNDDYTPMEFVVNLLKEIFGMQKNKALQVMFQVHYEGQASCGFYVPHKAKEKVHAVTEQAKASGFPLNCRIKRPIG